MSSPQDRAYDAEVAALEQGALVLEKYKSWADFMGPEDVRLVEYFSTNEAEMLAEDIAVSPDRVAAYVEALYKMMANITDKDIGRYVLTLLDNLISAASMTTADRATVAAALGSRSKTGNSEHILRFLRSADEYAQSRSGKVAARLVALGAAPGTISEGLLVWICECFRSATSRGFAASGSYAARQRSWGSSRKMRCALALSTRRCPAPDRYFKDVHAEQ